jgi:hypothetical protein
MNLRKMLLLAALVCVGVLVGGTATASASKVCSKSGTGSSCGAGHGNVYTGALKAQLKAGTTLKWTSSFITITCLQSTMEGSITNGETGTGNVTSVAFGSCSNSFGTACTAKTTASTVNPWPVTTTTTKAPNGTAVVKGFTTSFSCTVLGSPVTCNYTSEEAGSKGELVITGGETAQFDATNVPSVKEAGSSSACSATATSSAEYTITTPDSLYLT